MGLNNTKSMCIFTKTMNLKLSKAIKYYKLTKYMANLFSKDPSTKVGALFMYPETLQILTMGYNGMPRGIDETQGHRWERPLKYKMTEHAERNAIYNAARSGTSLKDSICVVSMFPCTDCTRGIIQSGCRMVVAQDIDDYLADNPGTTDQWKEDWKVSVEMLNESGVQVIFLTNQMLNE